jgi:RIO-like serine/threonine protein kinase
MIEMEYADGGNLAEFLVKQTVRIEEKDILDILYQMVSAIRYMHAHHVLHRDLKTANIFLTREGTVKIGKFFRWYRAAGTYLNMVRTDLFKMNPILLPLLCFFFLTE